MSTIIERTLIGVEYVDFDGETDQDLIDWLGDHYVNSDAEAETVTVHDWEEKDVVVHVGDRIVQDIPMEPGWFVIYPKQA